MSKLIAEGVYIYSIWTGHLKSYKGSIYKNDYSEDLAIFLGENKRFLCSIKPVKMYNSTVWLFEKDDEAAIDIFVKYMAAEISTFQQKISNIADKIKTLKGEK